MVWVSWAGVFWGLWVCFWGSFLGLWVVSGAGWSLEVVSGTVVVSWAVGFLSRGGLLEPCWSTGAGDVLSRGVRPFAAPTH